MDLEEHKQDSGFILKRDGDFETALSAYASEYATARKNESSFIQEICFEQMFDVVILQFFKDQTERRVSQSMVVSIGEVSRSGLFESPDALREAIEGRIKTSLEGVESYDEEDFQLNMDKCWRKFQPVGRAKSPFSVHKDWLVTEKRKGRKR